jgi:hypothetical protein
MATKKTKKTSAQTRYKTVPIPSTITPVQGYPHIPMHKITCCRACNAALRGLCCLGFVDKCESNSYCFFTDYENTKDLLERTNVRLQLQKASLSSLLFFN